MNIIIKQLIICLIVFILFSYIQKYQDKINKVTYKNIYDEYKMPLFVSLVVGLILNIYNDIDNIFDTDLLALDKSEIPLPATIQNVEPVNGNSIPVESMNNEPQLNNEENIYTHLPTF